MASNRQILLVEDDEVILHLLKELLEGAGYQVASAGNGQEALGFLRSGADRPSIILLDLMMPVMDGFEFMSAQKEDPALAKIPVIAMSADNQIKEKLRETTACDYFKKPAKIATILELIEHYRIK